jgi:hypothetical protein
LTSFSRFAQSEVEADGDEADDAGAKSDVDETEADAVDIDAE